VKQQLILAQRYAQALFELSHQSDNIDTIGQQIDHFARMTETNADLKHLFFSPIIHSDQRQQLVRIICERAGYHSITSNFLALLIEKKRSSILREIQRCIHQLSDRHYKRLRVYITSASPLSEQFISQLKQLLHTQTQQQIILHTEIDPSLLGGAVMRIGDKMLDVSIKTRISQMKKQILQQI
jgi:F-type H+-transporting ATPase subunit delta